MKSYARTVSESASQPNLTKSAAPSYSELVRRLKLMAGGVDFLLGHPDLKPSDRELGLFLLRQTVLFGKDSDKSTAQQQARGVRNLNRGTGRHEKTLQRARNRLRKAGFMRVLGELGDRQGNTYSPDFQFILAEVEKLRTPEQIAPGCPGAIRSPHQSYPSGSDSQIASGEQLAAAADTSQIPDQGQNAEAGSRKEVERRSALWKATSIDGDDLEHMIGHIRELSEKYPLAKFGPLCSTTAHDLLAAARLSFAHATPDQVAAFLTSKFNDRMPPPYGKGISKFGGMIVAVHEDFAAWLTSHAHSSRNTDDENRSAWTQPPDGSPGWSDERSVIEVVPSQSESCIPPVRVTAGQSAAALDISCEVRDFRQKCLAIFRDRRLPSPPELQWWQTLYERIRRQSGHPESFLQRVAQRAYVMRSWGLLEKLVQDVAGLSDKWQASHPTHSVEATHLPASRGAQLYAEKEIRYEERQQQYRARISQ